MGFQILDSNGNAMTMNDIDKEVCNFWNVPFDEKHYAVPNKREEYPEGIEGSLKYAQQLNWYDSIGWRIHYHRCNDWQCVRNAFLRDYEKIMTQYNLTIEQIIPKEIALLEYFEKRNYQPRFVD